MLPALVLAFLIEAWDIQVYPTDPQCSIPGRCGGLECSVWAFETYFPGMPIEGGASCSIHSAWCTETGPAALFHIQTELPDVNIVGLCIRQLYDTPPHGECVEWWHVPEGGGQRNRPVRRETP